LTATPCQVDFYVLQDEAQSAELLACKLALTAWEHGKRIMVLVSSDADCQRLDELMWVHPQGRFLPHAPGEGLPAPVRIGTISELMGQAADVLINLTATAILEPARFQRLLELVPANDSQREASRQKFREYRARGLEPAHHPINNQ
jgi:DNA polymerase III subunit chi